MLSVIYKPFMLSVIMLNVIYKPFECHYAEYHRLAATFIDLFDPKSDNGYPALVT
jgi:hypothetical protein